MPPRSEEFLKRLRTAFAGEAAEHCQTLSSGLLQLEKAAEPDRPRLIETIFRSAHSLKGAARAVNFTDVESICHRLESVFTLWKRQPLLPAPGAFDVLHRAVDVIRDLLQRPHGAQVAPDAAPIAPLLKEIEQLERLGLPLTDSIKKNIREAPPAPKPVGAEPRPGPVDTDATVRVATERIERVLYATEELLAVKSALAQQGKALDEPLALLEQWRRDWAETQTALRHLRPSAVGAPALSLDQRRDVAALGELLDRCDVVNKTLMERLGALARAAERDRHASSKLIDSLLDETKKLLLLPFATEFALFSKLVRDLAREEGKEVEFIVRGGEVEIDKRILQEMKDPLLHLLRNCIGHGLERPEERVRAGKPARGTVTLAAAALEGQKVEIRVEDDGHGIDLELVKQAALRRGIVSPAALSQLSRDDALALIFRSEVSTARIVTEVSGRGVGLAIVSERVDKLGGRVRVQSESGRGTSFSIVLPVTQATFRGISVSVANRLFVLPATRVERVLRTPSAAITTVENREALLVNDRAVAFVWLGDVLELSRTGPLEPRANHIESVVLGAGEQRVAFGVDAVLQEQEVLVKPLRMPLRRVRNIAGATVLGSGAVVPILSVEDLLRSAVAVQARPVRTPTAPAASVPVRRTILVAEDSITSRMLLKNILESAGYVVKTAVDGLDALTTLRAERFDLVVSDIEMPRLNGFALTAAIRADRKLADLPVILVTALATREDRERGIDAGASAYIVKSDLDQSNLLEAVKRLV